MSMSRVAPTVRPFLLCQLDDHGTRIRIERTLVSPGPVRRRTAPRPSEDGSRAVVSAARPRPAVVAFARRAGDRAVDVGLVRMVGCHRPGPRLGLGERWY